MGSKTLDMTEHWTEPAAEPVYLPVHLTLSFRHLCLTSSFFPLGLLKRIQSGIAVKQVLCSQTFKTDFQNGLHKVIFKFLHISINFFEIFLCEPFLKSLLNLLLVLFVVFVCWRAVPKASRSQTRDCLQLLSKVKLTTDLRVPLMKDNSVNSSWVLNLKHQ